MTDPNIKARFTPHILDIRQSLARLENERKSSNNPGMGVEQAVKEPGTQVHHGPVTLHWADPTSPTGRTASPGWTEATTPDGLPILWKTADNGDILVTASPTGEPPTGTDDLHQQVANAIHYVMYGPGGDDTTRKLATTAAHAALSVRDLEVVELRRSLVISRKRTQHFARLYSDALDELEDA